MLFFAVVWEIGTLFYIPARPTALIDFVVISNGLLERQLLHRPHLWCGRAVPFLLVLLLLFLLLFLLLLYALAGNAEYR